MATKPILCIDFDGVIHSYKSGWKGADVITDDVVPGFFEWAEQAAQHFRLVVYSSRSRQEGGICAMQKWLEEKKSQSAVCAPLEFEFAHEKPAAYLTIDDRAICFDGTWPDVAKMQEFKPWNKQ